MKSIRKNHNKGGHEEYNNQGYQQQIPQNQFNSTNYQQNQFMAKQQLQQNYYPNNNIHNPIQIPTSPSMISTNKPFMKTQIFPPSTPQMSYPIPPLFHAPVKSVF